ncbi:hypothetical protein DA096_13430 [Vibrio rotiferianus]|jgi:hypothetical protein|uniref:Uncharacterized protein n=1 Tax=Vibrio rotiferianus TaxID=190895 RepID=A0A510I4L5_9VIBR|nr:hypothetical protein [Vibrio rotiferianus]TMX33621.1 hypothetical protein DA095_16845 [Vibrio rotiferianus]TMX57754.1 hypothetical protein DA093_05430 [Vibrio rotiferianus]TMX62781.1 hypothetical protein DA096_13430 [Vibrio rotiferianus]BBL88662.1 hypothetical protein VroAM7_13150 [Vibrio rotiferianus]
MSRELKERYTFRMRKRDLNALRHLAEANDRPIAYYADIAFTDLFNKFAINPDDFKDEPISK